MISLKNVLIINGATSGATGIGLAIFAEWMADLFQITSTEIFTEIGIFLIVFSALAIATALKASTHVTLVRFITALDLLWVITSFIVIVSLSHRISLLGNFIIAGVALWVTVMAVMQTKGLKKIIA